MHLPETKSIDKAAVQGKGLDLTVENGKNYTQSGSKGTVFYNNDAVKPLKKTGSIITPVDIRYCPAPLVAGRCKQVDRVVRPCYMADFHSKLLKQKQSSYKTILCRKFY